jgi:anti-anti-sigma factor
MKSCARFEPYSEEGRRGTYSRGLSCGTAGSWDGGGRVLGRARSRDRDEVAELLRSLTDENELVVADFSDAQFVDSSMLWVLKRANDDAEAKGRSFRIQLGTADILRRTFEVCGFFAILEIVPTREAALLRIG